MRSSFAGLELSKRAIQISQKALDITGNNLSNISTDGYSRQRVDTASLSSLSYRSWQTTSSRLSLAGQGVTAYGVSQVRNEYLDKRFRDLACYVAENDTKVNIMKEVETTLDSIENTGLDSVLGDFKSALTKYATNAADNVELASLVRNQAYNITTMLHTYSTDLENILNDNIYELNTTVDYVNSLVEKIAGYNKTILNEYKSTEFGNIEAGEAVSDYGPLELLDARNLLIDELSYYGDINVINEKNGTVTISMSGVNIVEGNKTQNLVMRDYENYGAAYITFNDGTAFKPQSGELKAYMDVLSGNGPYANHFQSSEYGIPYYKSALDAFAVSFSEILNTINGVAEGDSSRALFGSTLDQYDVDGNLIDRGAISAATIRISDEWMKDATMIGQIQNPETGEWTYSPTYDGGHDNRILLALQEPVKVGRANDYEGDIYSYVLFLSNRLGQNISFTEEQLDSYVTTANSILDSRDSVMGVSDTEEGINMLTYQKWFNASSRLMTTLDECLDRVINNMGRVGL